MAKDAPSMNEQIEVYTSKIRDRRKFRIFMAVFLTVLGFGLVYYPLSQKIATNQILVGREKKKTELIADIEAINHQVALLRKRMPERKDVNWWVEYILKGLSDYSLQLKDLEPKKEKPVGPFVAYSLRLELFGQYKDYYRFFHWVENNQKIMRVDQLFLERKPGGVEGIVEILGLSQGEEGESAGKH